MSIAPPPSLGGEEQPHTAPQARIAPPPAMPRVARIAAPPPIAAPVAAPHVSAPRIAPPPNNLDATSPLNMRLQSTPGTGSLAQRVHLPFANQMTGAISGGAGQMTNALEKIGTAASVLPDLAGAMSQDLEGGFRGQNPLERVRNSHLLHAITMMGNDLAHAHNLGDVQAQYYLTGTHNLQALAATGDKSAAFLLSHPWGNMAVTFAGELLDPVNWTPAGIGKLGPLLARLKAAHAVARAATHASAAAATTRAGRALLGAYAHPAVQRVLHSAHQIANEAFGSGAQTLDQTVAPGQEAAAHAARRAGLQANEGGRAYGKKQRELIFGTQAAEADKLPAVLAHQRKSKEAWLHLQQVNHPQLFQRAAQFLDAYRGARTANAPGVAAGTYEQALGYPSVADLEYPDVHHFAQSQLGDLAPHEQSHVLKLAREMELAREGPRMEDLTPEQAGIANRLRGVIGYNTAITHLQEPSLLEEGEQIGFFPKRDIYAFDSHPQGGTRGMNVGERIDPAKIPNVYRALKLWEHSQGLPPADRLLAAAPFSAKTLEQSVEDFLSTRMANLLARRAQRGYGSVHSTTGDPLIYEPPVGPMHDPATNTQVVPADRKSLESLVTGAQERAALEKMANVTGLPVGEVDKSLHARPQPGVAAGRARQAGKAAKGAATLAAQGNGQLERAEGTLQGLGPKLAGEQQAEEQALRGAVHGRPLGVPGEAVEPTRQEQVLRKVNGQIDALKARGLARAKALIDRYVPVSRAAHNLSEQIAARPGSRESTDFTRGYLQETQKALEEVTQRFRGATNIDPKERSAAIREIARSLHADVLAQQEPYWQALADQGGRIIPDQMWDQAKKRYVDQTRFDGLAPNLRGSAKRLREEQSSNVRYGNLDEITDALRTKLHQPELTDDEVLEWFKAARKPQLGAFVDEARKQFEDLTGTEARGAQEELLDAQRAVQGAKSAHKEQLRTHAGISPEERAVTGAARQVVQRESAFGRALGARLAGGVKQTGADLERVRGGIGKLQAEHDKIGARTFDVVDSAHVRQSKTLQAGVQEAHTRLARFGEKLDRYAQQASSESKLREVNRQYARLSALQKAHLRALYRRVLKDLPRRQFYPEPTYDRSLYVPAKAATVHGQPYNILESDGKVVHKGLLRQLEYDHAPYQEADAAARAVATLWQVARGSTTTNLLIHPIFNQGMMYAFETGDWLGLAQHTATVAAGALDPLKALKTVPGAGEDAKIANGLGDLLRKTNRKAWEAVDAQRREFADELDYIKQYHGFTETAPLEMDTRDFSAPQYDAKGKLVGFARSHDLEMDPAHIESTKASELPARANLSKAYRAFARWNHKAVWEISEPLLMARWVRYFMRKQGMDPAQAVDAARERLGTDKLTKSWRNSGLLFPRWTRTVLFASARLGLLKPGTWNVPLQSTRTEREGVGAGDVPTGLNPMALAIPDGTGPSGAPQFEMLAGHNPMATPLNTLAAGLFGDPRYPGLAGHLFDPVEFYVNRLGPGGAAAAAAGAGTLGTALSHRWMPGSLLRPQDLKLSPLEILLRGLMGAGSRVVAPLQNATDAAENPLSVGAGLTGSTLYPRSADFHYPEAP